MIRVIRIIYKYFSKVMNLNKYEFDVNVLHVLITNCANKSAL